MEVDHVLAYGLRLTDEEARFALTRLGHFSEGDEPVWDLAIAIGVAHSAIGNCYDGGANEGVIHPTMEREPGQLVCDPEELKALVAMRDRCFPDRALEWHDGEFIH